MVGDMDSNNITWDEAGPRLALGEVGVLPTDTLYGIVGSSLKTLTIERIYTLRKRELDKPLIVLINDRQDLARFGVELNERTQKLLDKVWPGPVSVIVSVESPEWAYLHRGTRSIAFRVPNKPRLRELLSIVGPLSAPSANLAGEQPAETIAEAKAYFGDAIFYVDEGKHAGAASALVDARTEPMRILRPAPGFRLE